MTITPKFLTFHLPKSGPEDSKRASAYVPALLDFAKLNGLHSLPITLGMIEDAEAEDLKWTNHDFERAHDVLADMIATIERRLPGKVNIRVLDRFGVLSVSVAVSEGRG